VRLFILSGFTCADRVAVVISWPDGAVYTKCLNVERLTNAYDLLGKTGLNITWSSPGPWGHGLCSIEATGCPAKNCFCDPEKSWRFYEKRWTASVWDMSMKSFDGGNSCDEHYCAQDGDVIGLVYGPDGTEPAAYVYPDVCQPVSRSGDSGDKEEETTTTLAKASTTTKSTTTTEAAETTPTEEATTTTEEAPAATIERTTTSTEVPVATTEPAPTTTTIQGEETEETTTTLAEKSPGIVGQVIAFSV